MSKNNCNHTGTRREDWGTPQWLFDALRGIFDFKVDLAANRYNRKLERYLSPAEDFLSGGFDTLLKVYPDIFWSREWAWCNPPYGTAGCGKWMKSIFTVPNTASLIPASVGAKWYRQCWDMADAIVFFHKRLRFEGAPGTAQFDSCIVVNGGMLNQAMIYELSLLGRVVLIRDTIPMCE
jgi:hypothetical protein